MDTLRLALGMGGRRTLLRAVWIPDHFDPADHARQAEVLSQLSCAPCSAHLAGLHPGARTGVHECSMVHRPRRMGCGEDSTVARLHLLCTKLVSPDAASCAGAHVGAG